MAPKGSTGCGAKLARLLGEGLGGRAKETTGRLVRKRTLRLEVGGCLWDETAEPTYIDVEAATVVVLAWWGKFWLRSSDATGLTPPNAAGSHAWTWGAMVLLSYMAWISPISG